MTKEFQYEKTVGDFIFWVSEWWCKLTHSHKHWVYTASIDKRGDYRTLHCTKCHRNWRRQDAY